MLEIGELVIYSGHGICRIKDIVDRTISGKTRKYYVLYPLEDAHKLSISIPVDNKKVQIYSLMTKEEAEEVMESFKEPGVEWIEKNHLRYHSYNKIINTGDRKEIVKVLKTLMLRKLELEKTNHKLGAQDRKIIDQTENILFKELAIALDLSYEEVVEKALQYIKKYPN